MKVILSLILALTLIVCVLANSAEYAKLGSGGSRATTCSCGWKNHPKRRIFGGEESSVNEWPMIAALIYMPDEINWGQYCGSTIITNRHVVSAAHCFREIDPITEEEINKDPNKIRVLVSAHDWTQISDPSTLLRLETYDIHESYDHKTLQNDVAIATVQGLIPMSATVGPACFPQSRLNLNEASVIAVGWGMTSWYGGNVGTTSPILKKAYLTAYDTNTSGSRYPKFFNTSYPHQICTYNPGTSICLRDSGGPLFWYDSQINRYVLVGISSFVPKLTKGFPHCQNFSGYVDSSAFIRWVKSKIKIQKLCQKI